MARYHIVEIDGVATLVERDTAPKCEQAGARVVPDWETRR